MCKLKFTYSSDYKSTKQTQMVRTYCQSRVTERKNNINNNKKLSKNNKYPNFV